MSPKYFFAIAGLLVFVCAFEADALKCYLCGGGNTNSTGIPDCTDKNFGNEVTCDFAPQGASCTKSYKGAEIVHRGCYIQGFCDTNPNCSECDKDLCNASNQLILPLVLINALIFLLFRLF